MKRANFIMASGEALPFKDKAFEWAFSFDVLEHVNGPVYFVQEMKRVAYKVLIVTPNSLHLPHTLMSVVRKSQKYEPYSDHVVIWSKAEMIGLLNRVGFKSYTLSWTNFRRHKAHGLILAHIAGTQYAGRFYHPKVGRVYDTIRGLTVEEIREKQKASVGEIIDEL